MQIADSSARFHPAKYQSHTMPANLELATLVGARQLETSLRCLRSLVRYSILPIVFRVHCDGTLTRADREQLSSELPIRRFVPREEADAVVAQPLAALPNLKLLRDNNVLALKLIDVVAFEQTPRLSYVDSDVLFLRPFRFAVEQVTGDLAVFFPDLQSAYSLRSTQLLSLSSPLLPARVNTGLFSVPVGRIDFAVADRFLASWNGRSTPWIEQTCWALCAGVRGTSLFDWRQMTIPSGRPHHDSGLVALHFVSPVRARLSEFADDPEAAMRSEPILLKSKPARRLTAGGLLLDELRRRFQSRRTV